MANSLDDLSQNLKNMVIKVECEAPESIWKRIKSQCAKKVVTPLPLDTPLNPDKVTG